MVYLFYNHFEIIMAYRTSEQNFISDDFSDHESQGKEQDDTDVCL